MQKNLKTPIILLTVLLIASLILLGTQVVKKFILTSGEVTLKGNSIGEVVKTWDFSTENAMPGDSESREYTLRLSLEKDASLIFCPSVAGGERGYADALLLRVENTSTGRVLCDGKFSELDGHGFAENFAKKEKRAVYKITVTVDPAAGNEYQNAECKLGFRWSFAADGTKEGDVQ